MANSTDAYLPPTRTSSTRDCRTWAWVARLLIYKGFGHGISKPKERLAAQWHNWQWFEKHVWGIDLEMPLPPTDDDEGRTD